MRESQVPIITLWLVVSALVFCAITTFAEDSAPTTEANPFLPERVKDRGWPTLRGADFDAHSAEMHIANQWPHQGPPVLWARELGQGYSAFVAVGDRVYTQAQSISGQFVYSLDADTGESLWEHRYDWPYERLGVYPGPRSTPTVYQNRVYFTSPSGMIRCLSVTSGETMWTRDVVTEYQGRGGIEFGYACSPTVVDDLVLLPVGGKSASIVALDATNGKTVWATGSDRSSYASAMPITYRNRKLVVGFMENALVIYDRNNGDEVARHSLSLGYDEHSCWPIYREPYLWIASPFREGSQLLKLPETLATGNELSVVWGKQILSNDVVSSVLVDGQLYGFDIFDVQAKTQRPSRGKFRCIDYLTGEELWEQGTGRPVRRGDKVDPQEIGQASIIAVDGKLIMLNERGELILLRATPRRLEELARASVLSGELTWTPPILHRGRVYLRNHTRAVCVYVGKPAMLNSPQQLLTVADVPQSQYFNLAAIVMPVEPEYMFDVPSYKWLLDWYLIGIAILLSSHLSASLLAQCVPIQKQVIVRNSIYYGVAFTLGAIGTTLLSQYQQQFLFTWPVCLFIAFEPVVAVVRSRKIEVNQKWRERLIVCSFTLVCLIYFLLCRRLSLVFEWTFLIGFVGAVPFCLWGKHIAVRNVVTYLFKLTLVLIAFTAFYGVSVLPLLIRY